MFVLRSAFWLTAAFFLIAPHGTDFGATAGALKDQAIAAGIEAGQQLIVSEITQNAGVSILPKLTQQIVSQAPKTTSSPVIFPRPRPAALS